MRKRIWLVRDDSELREIQQIARRRRLTVAEWVRQALRAARQREPGGETARKLEAVRRSFATAPIDEMLVDIERGYSGRAG